MHGGMHAQVAPVLARGLRARGGSGAGASLVLPVQAAVSA